MEQLFDLLFSNFVIIAAVIGGLISWFNRTKNKDKDNQPSPVSQRPAHQEIPGEPSVIQAEKQDDEKMMDIFEKAKERENRKPMERYVPKEKNQPVKHNTAVINLSDPAHWNRKKISEGILMAEILGPPRARKPHRTNIYRNL